MALLSWSEPRPRPQGRGWSSVTTTLSPAFRPLTTCVVAVADDAGLDALRCLRAVGASTVTVEPRSAWLGPRGP